MEKKSYILVTENNYWASTLFEVTEEELKKEVELVRKDLDWHNDDPKAKIYAYEINRVPITFTVD